MAADAGVVAGLATRGNRHGQHDLDRVVALVEGRRDGPARVAVDGERELRHVVRADREAVEVLEKIIGEQRVRRNLAHHDDP